MKVYVASSWRNKYQPHVVKHLRAAGHEVYDFRNAETAFDWREIDSHYPWDAETMRKAMRHPVARAGYDSDMDALRDCDACLIVLPCGRSAHWELGYAQRAGKRTMVLVSDPAEPEVVYMDAEVITSDLDDIISALDTRIEQDKLREAGQALYDLLTEHMPDTYVISDSRMEAWRAASGES
jgi:nucleoside 2-deoxyribosyltransferase